MSTNYTISKTYLNRPHNRRLARIWFSWMHLIPVLFISFLSWNIIDHWLVITWAGFTMVLIALDDLVNPNSVLNRFYYRVIRRASQKAHWQQAKTQTDVVFTDYPAPALLKHRDTVHPLIHLLMFMLSGSFAVLLNVYHNGVPEDVLLVMLLVWFFSLLPFMSVAAFLRGRFRTHLAIWIALAAFTIMTTSFAFLYQDIPALFALGSALVVMSIFGLLWIVQRLWEGYRRMNKDITSLSHQLLTMEYDRLDYAKIINTIGRQLDYDRLFFLRVEPQVHESIVVAQYGDFPDMSGQAIPLDADQSITGRAYWHQHPVLWNDVNLCPYYHQSQPINDTQAELAVPVAHQGVVFGILDVQSHQKNVYGPADVDYLETIANILGAAIAVRNSDRFYNKAVELWTRLSSMYYHTEDVVFGEFSIFARDELGVDLAIYYPLTPTGWPMKPLISGELQHPDVDPDPYSHDGKNRLLSLLAAWETTYENQENETNTINQEVYGFNHREGIRAFCFIPIGSREEPLGGLFFNFRRPRHFDKRFRFTILSLAQAFATVVSRMRHRHVIYEGFGRPELGIHSIVGRYGWKQDRRNKALYETSAPETICRPYPAACALHPVIQSAGEMIDAILLAESSIPPSFWEADLHEELRKHAAQLPAINNDQPVQVQLHIDTKIERENPWVKLALYRVVTETLNNAVFHGMANVISLRITRQRLAIAVVINNDGKLMPDDAKKRQSESGIFALLAELESKFYAKSSVISPDEFGGTQVSFTLPALPPVSE